MLGYLWPIPCIALFTFHSKMDRIASSRIAGMTTSAGLANSRNFLLHLGPSSSPRARRATFVSETATGNAQPSTESMVLSAMWPVWSTWTCCSSCRTKRVCGVPTWRQTAWWRKSRLRSSLASWACFRLISQRWSFFYTDTKTMRALTFQLNEDGEFHLVIIASNVRLDIPDQAKLVERPPLCSALDRPRQKKKHIYRTLW